MVEQDLLYAYQGLKDTTKGEESVEDRLPTSITQSASNLHSDEDMEDNIKLLDPRMQNLIRTYLEVFGEIESAALGRCGCRRARGRQDQWGRHARSLPGCCYWV